MKNNESLSAAERSHLIKQKRATITKPLIHAVSRISEITSQLPGTKHEQWFQSTYSVFIQKGLHQLKHPEKEEDLQSDWLPLKQVKIGVKCIIPPAISQCHNFLL